MKSTKVKSVMNNGDISMPSSNNGFFKRKSAYDRTHFFGRIWFCYVYPLFWKGVRNNGLSFDDIHQCPQSNLAENVGVALQQNWLEDVAKAQKAKHKKQPALWWTLFRTYAPHMVLPICLLLFNECFLHIVQPFLLGQVIQYFSGTSSIDYGTACWYAAGICATIISSVFLVHPTYVQVARISMNLRVACCALMYRKSLRLSQASLHQTTVGKVINMMSNDVNRFDEFGYFSTYLITGPVQLIIVAYIVWQYIGIASLGGFTIMALFIPFQAIMGRLFTSVRQKTANLTDTRLRFMNEIISGMRVIKMYCWERPFAARVADARIAEIGQIRKACYLKAINLSLFFIASRTILFVCFSIYVLLGNLLTPEAVMVTMALWNTLRLTMTLFFPQAIGYCGELRITCKRIQNFLLLDEMPTGDTFDNESSGNKRKQSWTGSSFPAENGIDTNSNQISSLSTAALNDQPEMLPPFYLNVSHITARWMNDLATPTLFDISFELKPGDLLAVIGPVGTGKSSLLMSLLRELPLQHGRIEMCGSLAYVSQEAWTFNDTVRANILFGMDYDQSSYDRVIDVCALQRDLHLMPFGDRTLVGERGVSLSGGQKARINLARAIYRDADLYLLDDPLSAVDTTVVEHIFERCILEYLQSKIRILVTHQIQFIEKATKILVLTNGSCLAYGTFDELNQRGIDFMSLIAKSEQEQHCQDGTATLTKAHSTSTVNSMSLQRSAQDLSRKSLSTEDILGGHENPEHQLSSQMDDAQEIDSLLPQSIEQEQYSRGSIKCRVYAEYIRAGAGPFLLIIMILFTLISQTLFNGSDIFLTIWTNKNQEQVISANKQVTTTTNETISTHGIIDQKEQTWDLIIYSVLIASLFFSTIIRSISFFAICMRASVGLHNNIFARLLRTPVAFFDLNPTGRILNRFTKDLGIIDESLPYVMYDLNLIILQAIGIIVSVAYVNWYLVFPAIFITSMVLLVRGMYVKSARDIKRFEGLTRSPIYSHVYTTLNGLASIRAFGAQRSFESHFYQYQNDHTATWFLFISSSRALGLIIDSICIVFNIITVITIMLANDMAGGDAGLAISSGLLLAGMSQWGVRQSAEFESQMASVERIVEYQDLEQEASAVSTDKSQSPPSVWPNDGAIEFDHLNLAYNTDKLVLQNICCSIDGGSKVGIVGRTGAGKSSLIAALFRLTEPTGEGTIRIDNVDIRKIGLDELRKVISIIPQTPVVFTGSVRYNLDPFGEYNDEQQWAALEEVQLKQVINQLPGKLDAPLSEGGANLSVGQRQLICLARAILRHNRILILDEATANVDHQTDALIQHTIRHKFAHCTVLTIAHRLNTIIDADRVLVLDAGQVLECDTPYRLLKKRDTFYAMCRKTGTVMFNHLYRLAKLSHQKNTLLLPSIVMDQSVNNENDHNEDDEYDNNHNEYVIDDDSDKEIIICPTKVQSGSDNVSNSSKNDDDDDVQ